MYSGGEIVGSITEADLTFSHWIANALFLQTIFVDPFGTNGALWSLTNEFWYYAACPFLIYLIAGKRAFLSGLMLILLLSFTGVGIAKLFPLWLMGVAVFVLSRKKKILSKLANIKYFYIILLLFFLVVVAFRVSSGVDKDVERYTVGFFFSLLMLVVLANDRPLKNDKHYFTCFTLASFSYSLYVIHTPLLGTFRALIISDNTYLAFNYINIGIFLAVITSVVLFSFLFAVLTERNTGKLYNKLRL